MINKHKVLLVRIDADEWMIDADELSNWRRRRIEVVERLLLRLLQLMLWTM